MSEISYLTIGLETDNISTNICFNDDDDTLDHSCGITNDSGIPVLAPKRQRSAVSFRDDDTDNWGSDQLNNRDEHILQLHNPKLKNALLGRVNMFRKNRELCDVSIFVKEREFAAHKVVLASVSPSFLDMFSKNEEGFHLPSVGPFKQLSFFPLSNSTETTNGGGNVSDHTIIGQNKSKHVSYYEFLGDLECFQAILDYAYTSSLEIRNSKVAELYRICYALQIRPLVKACARYLASNLSVENCIGSKIDQFLKENIEKVYTECVEFTRLPCIRLKIIVNVEKFKKKLILAGNLVEKALKYFQETPKNTDKVELILEMLADKVHLFYYEEENLLQDCAFLDDKTMVGSSDIVQEYKRSKQKCHALINKDTPQATHHISGAKIVRSNGSIMENNKYNSNESLNSLASSQSEVEDEIEYKVIAVHKISHDCFIALTILYHRLVVLSIQTTENDEVVKSKYSHSNSTSPVLGNNGLSENSSDKDSNSEILSKHADRDDVISKLVDPNAVARIPLPVMSVARCSTGAVFLNGKIIICGGYDRGECLKSVEEYDIENGQWKVLQNMSCERGRLDSAVCNNKVYAIGGSSGSDDLKSCEVFEPLLNKWKMIRDLPSSRSQNACAVMDDKVFCIGGIRDQVVLKDCERYSPSDNEWVSIAPLQTARSQAACISWKNMLVVIGGTDRWLCLSSVEAYDSKTNSWKYLNSLKTPRRGCAVAVVNDSLYVIGGNDGTQSLTSVEILNSPNGQWRPGPNLTTPRANTHAIVTSDNVIYVIGGYNGQTFLNTIELLEDETLGWRSWKRTKEDKEAYDALEKNCTSCNIDEGSDTEVTPRANIF
ncbi:Influenza virus NS1A-binding protein [Strongyloides ratti]|uniref:Influenza virus NS1A-binding protein n=1 Tax=Strongyloides ratti TaxID=34506 RepID=A0A090KYW5_STRRB|nr:Influenza virus NS1A-binding protein [Strongyloides ratti]CEF61082.1 Influenza virus NS1A-binding protein [Strongyloides ratti]